MIHHLMGKFSAPEQPHWWAAWCSAAWVRLARSDNPFGLVATGEALSAFALGGKEITPDADDAKSFATTLARIQTERAISVEYALGANCADLDNGQIFLDPNVIITCPYRPAAGPAERLDILSGLSLHEAGHQAFSSATLCAKARKRGDLFFQIFNLLDDEFVEMKVAERSPGYTGYVRAARQYFFGDAHQHLVKKDQSLLSVFLLFVRYPQALSWTDAAPYLKELEQIRSLLTPFPHTEEDVYRVAEAIYRLLDQSGGPKPSKQLLDYLKRVATHDLLPDNRSAAKKHLAELKRANLASAKEVFFSTCPPQVSKAETSSKVTWEYPAGDKLQYEEDRRAVLPHLTNLRRWLKKWEAQRTRVLRGKSSGSLDRQKLYSLAFGNEYVFQRRGVDHQGMTVVLLIDESGSMGGDKITKARQVAILFKEALSPLKEIELFIYGHTADLAPGTTNLYCYWAPRAKNKPYSLGTIQARGNNRDGVAIQAVAQEVKRHALNSQMLMLVISDGDPVADKYRGKAAIEHTRKVVRSLRPLHIIHIGIDPSVNSADMFDYRFGFTDLADLPRQMSRLLEKALAAF